MPTRADPQAIPTPLVRLRALVELFQRVAAAPQQARAGILEQAAAGDAELAHAASSLLRRASAAGRVNLLEPSTAVSFDSLLDALDEACADLGGASPLGAAPLSRANGEPAVAGATVSVTPGAYLVDPLEDSMVGRQIDRFRVLRVLGSGGMGVVYEAVRTTPFEQRVAIKVIEKGRLDPVRLARFETERRLLARLEHPNVAHLLDAGNMEDGSPYYVMELVDGARLDHYCNSRQLGIEARLRLLAAVCGAVQYAHQNLVLHRDLKPANILVTESGVPKLLDFGIAKALVPEQSGPTTLVAPLTPEYASPEQLRNRPVTTATDIYQLGVLLHELLTGLLPYQNDDRMEAAVRRVVAEDDPPPPSRALVAFAARQPAAARTLARARGLAPARLVRRVRGDCDAIAVRALAVDPLQRYPTVQALQDDLLAHLAGLPVRAKEPGRWQRAVKFVRRNRVASLSLALLVASLAAGAAISTRLWRQASAERDAAASVTRFLQEMLASPDPADIGPQARVEELLDRAAAEIERRPLAPAREAELRVTLGRTYRAVGKPAAAVAQLDESLALYAQDRAADSERALAAEYERAAALADGSDSRRVRPAINAMLGRCGRLLSPSHPLFLRARSLQALVLADLGFPVHARHAFAEIHREQVRVLGGGHEQTLETALRLARSLVDQGEAEQAERLTRGAARALAAWHPADHPAVLSARLARVLPLAMLGRLEEADAELAAVLARAEGALGSDHPRTLEAKLALSYLRAVQGRLPEAYAATQEAYEQTRRVLGDDHWMTMTALNNLAAQSGELGDFAAAERHARAVFARRQQVLGENHTATIDALHNLAYYLHRQGRISESEALIERELAIMRGRYGEESRAYLEAQNNRALLYVESLRYQEALALYQRLLPVARRVLPAMGELRCVLERAPAGVLRELGRFEEAEALLLGELQRVEAALPGQGRDPRLADTLDGLARLYRAWGQASEAEVFAARAAGARPERVRETDRLHEKGPR